MSRRKQQVRHPFRTKTWRRHTARIRRASKMLRPFYTPGVVETLGRETIMQKILRT